MSIYSGFGTRQEESAYNSIVEATIKLMQSKIAGSYKNEKQTIDPSFKIQLLKHYEMMKKLEKHKYLEPKFSEAIREVVVKIVKEQVRVTPEKPENFLLTSSQTTFKLNGSSTERSATPTLPTVKTQIRLRTHTPIRDNKSDTGFLFARLKKPN